MFENLIDKFENFTVSSDKTVNQHVIEYRDGQRSALDLNLVLLNDCLILLEKAILNKLSSDLLFKQNYWTWGFVTVYYSNFYLAQILNRLSNRFYVYARKDINIEITFDVSCDIYVIGQNNGDNTHQREFKLLKANYSRYKTERNDKISQILSAVHLKNKDTMFKYTIDNEIKESEIRNQINYQLKHYKEIHIEDKTILTYRKWYEKILNNQKFSSTYPNYFQLLMINEKRFLFLAVLLKEIKAKNSGFSIKLDGMHNKIKAKYSTVFHDVDTRTKNLIEDLLK